MSASRKRSGPVAREAGDLAEAHQAGLPPGPAEDVVPDQKRRQPPGRCFSIQGDCQALQEPVRIVLVMMDQHYSRR